MGGHCSRRTYLLDLFLSDHPAVKAKLDNKIADHSFLVVHVPDGFEERKFGERHVWHYRDANWTAMEETFENIEWHHLQEDSTGDAADFFFARLHEIREAHVPPSMKSFQKSSLPWLNHTCEMAIVKKHIAEGSENYNEECEHCRQTLKEEHGKYKTKLRKQIENLPHGSKKWWRLNKKNLSRESTPYFFPLLQDGPDVWHRSPQKKTDLFVECCSAKNQLPLAVFEQAFFAQPPMMNEDFAMSPRVMRRLLFKLREDQATGPDDFGVVFLKRMAKNIDLPLTLLCRRIFSEAKWPHKWSRHYVVALFKKESPYLPSQYRGIHLTSIMSKTIERMIGQTLVPFLEARGFGTAQWAFRKKASAKDLVTISLAKWILSICNGCKIGIYLSDISGAFDKVSRQLLICKLAQLGLPNSFLDVLNDYLMPRDGYVTVENAISEAMLLWDMKVQGTILESSLWNAFFADVATAVPVENQEVNLFADDLTGTMTCAVTVSNDVLTSELHGMQARAHAWGRQDQVSFDPAKEFFKVLHSSQGIGEPFKMLGTKIDVEFTMQPCIENILTQSRPKIRAILRSKDMCTTKVMMNQYKTHVWSRTDYHNGALILALDNQLQRIDKMQHWFLHELDVIDTHAFVEYNFALPSLRRRIGMLGFLHKRILGVCHPALWTCLEIAQDQRLRYNDRCLLSHLAEVRRHSRSYNKSLYMYVLMYNRLSHEIVDIPSVTAFQAKLTSIVKDRARQQNPNWRCSYKNCKEGTDFFYG